MLLLTLALLVARVATLDVDPLASCVARGLIGGACLDQLASDGDALASCACYCGVMRAASSERSLTPLQRGVAAYRPTSTDRCQTAPAAWLGSTSVDSEALRSALCDAPLIRSIDSLADELRGRSALEIGGPSDLFEGASDGRFAGFGFYPRLSSLDNVEFAESTAWSLSDGGDVRREVLYDATYLAEAGVLEGVKGDYGAILASHVLEHLADPIRALRRWKSKLSVGGVLVVVVPEPRGTFDFYRNATTLATLNARCLRRAGEDDLSSLAEVLGGLPFAGEAYEAFVRGALDNPQSRTLHHTVFDFALLRDLTRCVGGLDLVAEFAAEPFHLVSVFKKEEQDDDGRSCCGA